MTFVNCYCILFKTLSETVAIDVVTVFKRVARCSYVAVSTPINKSNE